MIRAIMNRIPHLLFALVVLATAGCATQPAPAPAAQGPRQVIEIVCQPPAQAGGATQVVVRNGITQPVRARVLWPNGVISTVVVPAGKQHVLMDLAPANLPCTHPLKLLDWSAA